MSNEEDIEIVHHLAQTIWVEYYTNLLGSEQVSYMLSTIQSKESIAKSIQENELDYYLVCHANVPLGYFAYHYNEQEILISKCYLHQDLRGKGLFKQILNRLENKYSEAMTFKLFVNKHNQSRFIYEHLGFKISKSIEFNIGQGYIMDDYEMIKTIERGTNMGMNKEWEAVKEFHETFKHPVADKPKFMHEDRAKARYAWMLEEIDEFLEADDVVEQADAMIDTIYFALGTLVELGIKPEPLFEIVQEANMSKLWADGKPHFNEMGKTIKPEGWQDPHEKLKAAIKEMEEA